MGAEKVVPREPLLAIVERLGLIAGEVPGQHVMHAISTVRRDLRALCDAAPAQPATAVGEAENNALMYRTLQRLGDILGADWTLPENLIAAARRLAHPAPPTLHTAPDAGEVVGFAVFGAGLLVALASTEGGARSLGNSACSVEPLVRKSAYDALAAERDRLRESLHYANGTAELAMKHRDAAEAARDAAVGVLRGCRGLLTALAARFRQYEQHHAAKPDPEKARVNRDYAENAEAGIARINDLLTEASREG